jgi:hypothetical protein
VYQWNINTYFPNALFAVVCAALAVWLVYNSGKPNHVIARPC